MGRAQPEAADAGEPPGEAIERLFNALESPLLGYARRLTGDPGAAEDVVQEAFMRLQSQFDQVRAPRQWLFRTVHNGALNQRRRAAKLVAVEPESGDGACSAIEPLDPQPAPDEELARWEGIGLVRLTIDGLEPRSRELIRMKFQEQLSYKEISERTGLKVGHVGYLLHHAVKAIAAELAKAGMVP